MNYLKILIALFLISIVISCTRQVTPFIDVKPIITFRNDFGAGNNYDIQSDTIMVQQFGRIGVVFGAANGIKHVSISSEDSSFNETDAFTQDLYFNKEYNVNMIKKDKTYTNNWSFKVTDVSGNTTEKIIKYTHIDTFKLVPTLFHDELHSAFNLKDAQYTGYHNPSTKAVVDIADINPNYQGTQLSGILHATPESGTKFYPASELKITDMTITKDYIKSHYTNFADSVYVVGYDVIICKLRNQDDYVLIKPTTFASGSQYAVNYYIFGYRKIE